MRNLKKKIENFLKEDPYVINKKIKKKLFLNIIKYQLKHHLKSILILP